MRVILCDRCGAKVNEEDVRKTMTIVRNSENGKTSLIHCDRLKLTTRGEIHTDFPIDLCDSCKASFVAWYGKIGIYER